MAKSIRVLKAVQEGDVYSLTWYIPNNKALWHKILELVKQIPGRYPSKDAKGKFLWKCPVNQRTTQLLTTIGFKIKQGKVDEEKREKVIPVIDESYKDVVLHNVDSRLRPYQYEGVQYLKQHNYRALVADPCGSGKSLHAVSCLREGNLFPALIIVPATLKLTWQREFDMWMPKNHNKKVHILEGNKPIDLSSYDVVIANYDILYNNTESIIKTLQPKICIADEFHVCKGVSSFVSKYYPDYPLKSNEFIHFDSTGKRSIHKQPPKRVQAITAIVGGLTEEQKMRSNIDWDGCEMFIGMSATFILNHPGDIFNALHLLYPEKVKSYDKFINKFCVLESGYKPGSMKITGGKNLDILNKFLLENCMLRRDKNVILPDVPPIINTIIPLQMTPVYAEQYQQIEEDFQSFVEGCKEDEEIPQRALNDRFRLLLKTACEGKFDQGVKFVDSLLAVPKEKVVLFCHHKAIVDKLKDYYGKKAVKLNGECSLSEKQLAVDTFMNDPKVTVFIGNIQAASVGLTLTISNKCVFFETGYSASMVHQASSRTARIGQEKDTCVSYFLTATDTIEQRVFEKLDKKQKISDKILDGIDTSSDDLLGELWKDYKKRLDKR